MDLYISILATVISFVSLGFSIFIYINGLHRESRQATIEAFAVLQESALDKLYSYTPKQIKEIAQHPRSQEYKDLTVLLVRCEHFSVGVNTGVYHFATIERLSNGYIVQLFKKIKPLIDKKREIGNGEFYKAFEKLAKKLDKKHILSQANNFENAPDVAK